MITLPGIKPVSDKDQRWIWMCGLVAWNTSKYQGKQGPHFGVSPAQLLALLPDNYRRHGIDEGEAERRLKRAMYACQKAVEAIIEADPRSCVRVVYEPCAQEATIPPFRINVYAWHRSGDGRLGHVQDDLDPMAATE